MKRISQIFLLALVLVGCNAVDDFNMWHRGCWGFPTAKEVEQTLAENQELFDSFRNTGLATTILVKKCPHGAYFVISHFGSNQKAEMLKAMDGIEAREEGYRMFFGVPFKFHNW